MKTIATRSGMRAFFSMILLTVASTLVCAAPQEKIEKLGDIAQIKVPANYVFLDAAKTKQVMEKFGNIVSGRETGMLEPDVKPGSKAPHWYMVFEWSPIGYVKDEEGAKLDAAAILKSITEGNNEANDYRKQHGQAPLNITGWHTPPQYNSSTHNLEWCVAAESEGEKILNFNIRMLGRGGVMEAVLVVSPEDLDAVLPATRQLISGFSYVPGQTYGEWKSGDKIAEYGLAALIAGGAAAVAVKSGLFMKLLKPIIAGIAIIGTAIAKGFKRIFGRGETQA